MIYQCFEIYKNSILYLYYIVYTIPLRVYSWYNYLDQLFLFSILQLLLKIDIGNKLLIMSNNYLVNGHKEKYFYHDQHLEKHTNKQSVNVF